MSVTCMCRLTIYHTLAIFFELDPALMQEMIPSDLKRGVPVGHRGTEARSGGRGRVDSLDQGSKVVIAAVTTGPCRACRATPTALKLQNPKRLANRCGKTAYKLMWLSGIRRALPDRSSRLVVAVCC